MTAHYQEEDGFRIKVSLSSQPSAVQVLELEASFIKLSTNSNDSGKCS